MTGSREGTKEEPRIKRACGQMAGLGREKKKLGEGNENSGAGEV